VNEDLRRAFAFVANGDMGGAHSEVSRFGLAVFDEALPLRYDSNYLLIDELPDAVSADELAAEARRLDRPAIMARDQRTGERLVPGFEQLDWKVHRGLVMAHRRKPERTADTGLVQEVDEAVLRPARRTQLAGEPWATPALVEQLLAAKLAIARVVVARLLPCWWMVRWSATSTCTATDARRRSRTWPRSSSIAGAAMPAPWSCVRSRRRGAPGAIWSSWWSTRRTGRRRYTADSVSMSSDAT
jgi:hypothetical protein